MYEKLKSKCLTMTVKPEDEQNDDTEDDINQQLIDEQRKEARIDTARDNA